MSNSKVVLGLKEPWQFSLEERRLIVEEFFRSGCTKRVRQLTDGKSTQVRKKKKVICCIGYAKQDMIFRRNMVSLRDKLQKI